MNNLARRALRIGLALDHILTLPLSAARRAMDDVK
jgi:hypothetical protein